MGVGKHIRILPVEGDAFVHWGYWGLRRFEFESAKREVVALTVRGLRYAR